MTLTTEVPSRTPLATQEPLTLETLFLPSLCLFSPFCSLPLFFHIFCWLSNLLLLFSFPLYFFSLMLPPPLSQPLLLISLFSSTLSLSVIFFVCFFFFFGLSLFSLYASRSLSHRLSHQRSHFLSFYSLLDSKGKIGSSIWTHKGS